ncbi:DUF4124 domain-containing protein [Neisseria dumasiana]|uniref:DUF4124 domain-containing protein n=1 Tax=Neisseria dumasiana TaxID=1931275 RepID=A0A1X3DK97_9NEIS|nr:YSIRK family Signal peptide [Neisseria sp. 74A18]OSI17027.1 DUF4124 domain-containing protein [Neisseria dumasiana]OSI23959.1 DUF4124 domain-containing protein [Neisseria dumasiana]OSI33327.1 DUF4124 domain-containing protein [Neisseria dumasiana]
MTRFAPLVLISGMLFSGSLATAEVYTWKNKSGGNSYSDVPQNLKASQSGTVNIRTHTVIRPAAPKAAEGEGTLADKQKELSDAIAEENKKIEERNKKVEEENRLQKEGNCKIARMNRQFAETARIANREEFVKRYDADVAKFCN